MRLPPAFVLLAVGASLLTAQVDPPVQLKLTCGKSPCRFQIGEVIPIELSFTSSEPKKHQINMATSDRSGRMSYETFHVTPEDGTRDPLQTYFASGHIGGGLTGFQFLSAQPVTIRLVMNEWVQFDHPGAYRVKVQSSRAGDAMSNDIELDVTPAGKDWQQRELQRIIRVLDDPKQKLDDVFVALRYLGTQDAARELARRLGTHPQTEWQCMFGLIGSPNAAAGLAEMRSLMRDPDFPVTSTFLRTMSYLPLQAGDSPEVLRKQQQANLDSARAALLAALPEKRGKAAAVSSDTALEGISAASPNQLRKALSRQLLQNFDALPLDGQVSLLLYRWDLVKDPSWIPVLEKYATKYEDFPQLREMHAYQSLQLSGSALQRWVELDPAAARPAVLAEIVRPSRAMTPSSSAFSKTIPCPRSSQF